MKGNFVIFVWALAIFKSISKLQDQLTGFLLFFSAQLSSLSLSLSFSLTFLSHQNCRYYKRSSTDLARKVLSQLHHCHFHHHHQSSKQRLRDLSTWVVIQWFQMPILHLYLRLHLDSPLFYVTELTLHFFFELMWILPWKRRLRTH